MCHTMNNFENIPDERTVLLLADLFAALGDPSRIKILAVLLDYEINVGDLAAAVGMSHSAVSHQLRTLRQLRIVRARKEGREVYYCLDDEHIADLYQRGLAHVQHG
ncbi:MAG: helix-turn-helix transcriptional regulator [Anaerolineales bacterium]|nr:helix-turn-helix transcriptional regulator [Anaerolineales bacterium]